MTENSHFNLRYVKSSEVIGETPLTADAGGPYSIAEGVPLTLDASKSSNPYNTSMIFLWDLDLDGKTDGMGKYFTHTWKDNSTFQISLTVSDGKNEDIDRTVVNIVDQSPESSFVFSPDRQKAGHMISFKDTSKSISDKIVSWSWDFDGKGASNDQHPVFVFQNKGQFVITLTVTDDDGSSSSCQKSIIVEAPKACEDCDKGILGNNCFIELIRQ